MQTIAFVTQKGGAGKTTLAISLAVAASEAGEKVIALDLDPQGSLSAWGNDRTTESPAVDRIGADRLPELPNILKALDRKGFTLAVLDCPGTASSGVNLAIQASDLCLIPTRPTRLDIRATKATVQALMGLKRPFAFVLNQAPPTARSSRAIEAASGLSLLGVLAEPIVALRTDFQDAVAAGQGVTEYAGHGKAADEVRQLWKWVNRRMKEK
jgi:chromosome partitioning protein